MGLNDTRDQLDACREQSKLDEQEIAALREAVGGLTRDLAETEHLLAQAESALADRLRHDAHGVAALTAELQSAHRRMAAITRLVRYIEDSEPLTAGLIRRILDEVTAEPWGAWLDLDDAHLAEKACRHSAASIRSVLELDPDRAREESLADWLPRLDALAERLAS